MAGWNLPKPKTAAALFVRRGFRALANCGTPDGSFAAGLPL